MIRAGVIGYGYWGPNLVRNFSELSQAEVLTVSDLRPERLALVRKRYPHVNCTLDHFELLHDPRIDCVAIATPVETHFKLAMAALQAGKHVLVEKPLTMNKEDALRLIEEADRRNLTLMVDHTFVYTGAVRKIRELMEHGEIGEIYYYDSVRTNLGLFQHDVSVIWDLATHDLSILDYLLPARPCGVSATGVSHVPGKPDNIAYLTLFFNSSLIAHFHVNWLAPVKVRQTLIGGSQKMIVYNDLEPSEKIKVYDKGITLPSDSEGAYQVMIGYRTGDMWAPKVDLTEALRTELLHLVECIESGKHPITDGFAGARIVQILEAAEQSVNQRGQPIELDMEWAK